MTKFATKHSIEVWFGEVKINPSKLFLKVPLTEKTSVKKGKSFSRDLKVKKITKGHAICPS